MIGNAKHLPTYDGWFLTDLNRIVGEQRSNGITSSKDITLLNAINRIFDVIANNPFYGENAKKDLIPKEYRQKYDADNLFIVDLPDYWRMIYTLESDEIEIIAFVLDIIDHDKYNKKFWILLPDYAFVSNRNIKDSIVLKCLS